MMRVLPLVALLLSSPALAGEVTLQNDSLSLMMEEMVFQAGDFVANEGVAETFDVPARYAPFRVVGVSFLAVAGDARFTAVFYKDTGKADPGDEVGRVTEKVTGNTMFAQRLDLTSPVQVNGGPIRVALFTDTDTKAGGANFVIDKKVAPAMHSTMCVMGAKPPCYWSYAAMLGVKGTWVVRLIIDSDAVKDTPDGGAGGGHDLRRGGDPGGGDPTVDSITPNMMAQGAGGEVVILGSNFADPGSRVTLNGPVSAVLSFIKVVDGRTIRSVIPAALPVGTYDVVVDNPGSNAPGRLAQGFRIAEGPGKGGCSAGAGPTTGLPGALAGLGVLVLLLRRRLIRS